MKLQAATSLHPDAADSLCLAAVFGAYDNNCMPESNGCEMKHADLAQRASEAGALLLNVVLAAFSPALARIPTAKTTPDGACAAGWDVPPGARGVLLRWRTDSALIIHVMSTGSYRVPARRPHVIVNSDEAISSLQYGH